MSPETAAPLATFQPTIKDSFADADHLHEDFRDFLEDVVEAEQPRSLCDLGGGANPMLELSYLRRQKAECAILDVSPSELAKAPAGYDRIVADLVSPRFTCDQSFDLVFSHMVAEHVESAEQFHRNVFSLLRPGGLAVHGFPTLYCLPFLVNRLTPERMADWLLDRIQKRDRFQHAKFPAYYHWCRGPGEQQRRRFERLGYAVVAYRGLFGHPYYGKWPALDRIQRRATAWLVRHPIPLFTSYAFVVLRRPRQAQARATGRERIGHAKDLVAVIDK